MANSSETVYGTNEEGHVMSEKVSSLATNIYKEFERMIKKYDEDVVKELMPLTVGLLESLDQALADKQEGDVELELLRDDNEQLLTQYEREKQLRKGAEQKYLEMEDLVEGERRELCDKVESMESIIRMLELKSKNSNDHISRLEEKETEMKKEYQKLHDRYTELFRTHCDYMERTKILMGTDKIDLSNSPRTKGFNLPNLRPVSMMLPNQSYSVPKMEGTPASILGMDLMSPRSNADSNVSIKSELGDLDSPEVTVERRRKDKKSTAIDTCDQGQVTDNIDVKEFGTTTKKTNTNVVRSSEKQEEPARVMSTPKQTDIISGSVDSSQGNTNTQSAPKESERSESKMEDSVRTVTLENGEDTKETTEHSMSVDSQTVIANTESDSEPQTHVRLRHSSFVHEEAEFEEDRIPGLDDTIAHIVATTPELQELEESMESQHSRHSNSRRNNDSIFDELQGQDADLGDDFGITGREVAPGEFASSGMGKELENLILENTELMETKNALNIVKDDLIAKVDELSSEMEILREEITSLQTVKAKLHSRIKELEEELKKTKEDLEKKNSAGTEENEDDVPMAQRKRFTRVEMARVLMERNQYKERLMELQEAVRWTEMIRASREHPEMSTPNKQKKSSIWNLSDFSKKISSFSNLFSSPNKPSKKPLPAATIKYNAPTTQVQPVGDPNKKTRQKLNLGDKAKAYDFLTDDLSSQVEAVLAAEPVIAQPKVSEKAKKEREKERREQYKQVRAHVKKDDGRLQAYGWSLPAKLSAVPSRDSAIKTQVPVPVPVYCRPLFDKDYGLKIWCAAGVNLTGGRTRDGGSVVGASVFYSSPPELEQGTKTDSKDAVEKLNQELKDHEENLKSAHAEQLSSYVWICNQTNSSSRVAVIDANNPGDVLETFRVSMSPILCVASVPGALESDYPVDEEILKAESYPQYKPPEPVDNTSIGSDSGIGGISFVQCATGTASPLHSPVGSPQNSELHGDNLSSSQAELSKSDEKLDASVEYKDKADTDSIMSSRSSRSYEVSQEETQPSVFKAKGSPVSSGTATPTSSASSRSLDRRVLQEQAEMVRDAISPLLDEPVYEDGEKMSSVLPTMWIGTQSGSLYVHSAVTQWRRCLHSVKLRDSVLFIVHLKGRVLAALADGTVAIFHRNQDGEWDVQNYHLLDMGKPHHSIRCMTVIANKHVWCGYGNKIYVVEPREMSIAKIFDAHPRKESQVRQMAWLGDGVWVSIRLDSTLRLYHAYTYQHLQDVDIEPYVSKMLGTGKLGFSFVRITAMLISCNRLWIGTGNGVVISVPLSESNKQTVSTASSGGRPGGIIRVYSDNKTEDVTPSSFTPYCSMAQAQLSFHGHRDAVKFFAAVPGSARKGMSTVTEEQTASNNCRHEAVPAPASHNKLVMSGGEGYVDFRIGDGDEDAFIEDQEKKISLSKGDRSHLIVWEVSSPEQ